MVDGSFRARKALTRPSIEEKYDYMSCRIGEGTYGVVYKGVCKDDRTKQFAIKKIKGTSAVDGLSMSACREISLLREIDHVNVVRLESVYLHPTSRDVYLVFDYAEHDLLQMITHHRDLMATARKKVPLPDTMIASLLWQILNGIHYLHANWILHRDLKPANILVMAADSPQPGVVKIADLGMARLFRAPLKPLAEVDPVVVTIWYRAPELLLGSRHYTRAVDTWSAGCIFAELITMRPIFHGTQVDDKTNKNPFQADQLAKIFQTLGVINDRDWPGVTALPHFGKLPQFAGLAGPPNAERPSLDKYFARFSRDNRLAPISPQCLHLLKGLLHFDPTRRLSAEQAMALPFFRGSDGPSMNCFAKNPAHLKYPVRRPLRNEGSTTGAAGASRKRPADGSAQQGGGAQAGQSAVQQQQQQQQQQQLQQQHQQHQQHQQQHQHLQQQHQQQHQHLPEYPRVGKKPRTGDKQ